MTNVELIKTLEERLVIKQSELLKCSYEIDRLEEKVKRLTKALANQCLCDPQLGVTDCPACKSLRGINDSV